MGGIVAVGRDLTFDMISSVTRGNSHPLPLGPIGLVCQDRGDDLESARVAETTENERHVSSDMPVLVTQPGHQGREYTRVVTRDDFLCNLELPKKHLLGLELLNQSSR